MPTYDQIDGAIKAVREGHASKEQERWASDAAKQAGERGGNARKAFQQSGKK